MKILKVVKKNFEIFNENLILNLKLIKSSRQRVTQL